MASNMEFIFDISKLPIDWSIRGNSHKYDEVFSLLDILSIEDHTHELDYVTGCGKSTSWEIFIRFKKEIPFNNFHLYVAMKRIDNNNYIVCGTLVIRFLNIEGKECPVPYSLQCIAGGPGEKHDVSAVDPHFNCLLRDEDHLTLPDDVLVLRLELYVKGCCRETVKDDTEIGRKKKVQEDKPKEEGPSKALFCSKLSKL